ncbi:adenylate cyclase 3 [Rhizobium sp. N113]|uniref:adenylate/guanylate cyclase domain-containing protein n=1 Tax=unclassified Rhizobium TaxID=2613769 RepID=UPI0007EB93AE|nr:MULTISPECIES: tetratricopeptide repeat protein [unclassified Rhizobium]ANL10284.1 adenylate cyclase 3 [Rhizobium sp. N1341]ANL22336.1 adenylate cyclase 3 [Rhizobium sp. N113]ANM41124.1 adenylate cyclase 3 [Rhizobium sp. N741]
MAVERAQRRLAAILAADVVGYSRLMGRDEAGTLAALKARRTKVLQPIVSDHRGRIVKLMGDGVLIEFASAVDAVECAVKLQEAMKASNAGLPEDRRIVLRIGVNLGDIIIEGGDLYGDGVNIAARLEGLSEAGGLCISGSVFEHVSGKVPYSFAGIGPQMLKNIDKPIHVYQLNKTGQTGSEHKAELPVPDKPSIAVLPFANLSGDADHQYFCDGVTDDIITDLSKASGLFVIASHSSFAFKDRSADIRSIARELGVRYVLEGSARRASGRIRVNAQLIDAHDGGHLWAERFDGGVDDVFLVQDEVTAKIVKALIGRLASIAPPRNRPTNLEAYDLCVRSRFLLAGSPQSSREARALLERAIALDPDYAEAHRWLAFNHWFEWIHWGEPMEPHRSLAVKLAQRATALDSNDAGARWILGIILVFERRWMEAEAEFETALRLDPNHADAWAMMSNLPVYQGRPSEAIYQVERALRLNPRPPNWYFWLLGQAQYAAGHYEAAVAVLRREETYRTGSRRILAASLAQLGRLDEARQEAEMFLISNPHFCVRHWIHSQPFRDKTALNHFIEGYTKAGLPD